MDYINYLAATTIQSVARMYLCRLNYIHCYQVPPKIPALDNTRELNFHVLQQLNSTTRELNFEALEQLNFTSR